VGEGRSSLEECEARLRLLISDESSSLPGSDTDRIEQGLIRRHPYSLDGLWTVPLSRRIAEKLEVRINNIRVTLGGIEEGWLVYAVQAVQLATGPNLLTLKLDDEDEEIGLENDRKSISISIEKIELDLDRQRKSS